MLTASSQTNKSLGTVGVGMIIQAVSRRCIDHHRSGGKPDHEHVRRQRTPASKGYV